MNEASAIIRALSPEWISAAFAAFSVLAAMVAMLSSRRATRNAFRLEWTRDVIGWGSRAISALADAHSLCAAKTEAAVAELPPRGRVLSDISALIDQGRLFFENRHVRFYGAEKPSAYRGHRPVMLDHLVAVHDCLRDAVIASPDKERVEKLWGLRREFVSELQRVVEPRWLSRQANYTRNAHA